MAQIHSYSSLACVLSVAESEEIVPEAVGGKTFALVALKVAGNCPWAVGERTGHYWWLAVGEGKWRMLVVTMAEEGRLSKSACNF